MQDTYPVIRPYYELHITSMDCTLFHVTKEKARSKYYLGMSTYEQWKIPRIAVNYLLKCDGKTKHEEICSSLNIPFKVVADRTAEFLAEQIGVISFEKQPVKNPISLFVTGSFDTIAPLHMSVEITDTCNFMCDHCYVYASPWKLGKREGESMRKLLDTMWANGVKVVELTGGECTTHPEFKEILAYSAEKFHLVAIVTNGFLIGVRDDLADWIASFDNVCVQVSIDGMRNFHDNFRKKQGAFDAACKAIRRLKERGVIIRLAMTVVPENIGQVKDVLFLCKQLGVDAFSVAVSTSFGRAANMGMCAEKDHELQHALAKILEPYANDPLFDANRIVNESCQRDNEINCGAGWRTFALNGSTGEIRSCLFLADSKKFGSVDRQSYGEIFKSEYMKMFKNAPSPSPQLETCRSCKYITACNGCFAKAFRVSETEYPECPWRKKYFPGMKLAIQDTSDELIQIRPRHISSGSQLM